MRKVRNITVAVTPELYRETRKLAAEMDSTVTEMVAYLLMKFPSALKAAGYKVTVPPSLQYHLPGCPHYDGTFTPCCPTCALLAQPGANTPKKAENSDCMAVKSSQPANLSTTSEACTHANTAAVRQYGDHNPSIPKDLKADSKSVYSRCTPVWQGWLQNVIARNK